MYPLSNTYVTCKWNRYNKVSMAAFNIDIFLFCEGFTSLLGFQSEF